MADIALHSANAPRLVVRVAGTELGRHAFNIAVPAVWNHAIQLGVQL